MKKLRCESCGGELRVEENGEYAYCDYCRTRYKLNEDKTVTIKIDEDLKDIYMDNYKSMKKIQKPAIIVFMLAFVTIFSIVIFGVFGSEKSYNKRSFNSTYEFYKGTHYFSSVESILNEASTNNQTKKRKITVVYDNKEYVDYNEITDLKRKINDGTTKSAFLKYEIKLEYDSKGYVSKVIIENLN